MHESVMAWVGQQVKALGPLSNLDVLEVGSYNVNGSVRPLFAGCRSYVGLDLLPGPGVDVVYHPLDWGRAIRFDVIVSTRFDVIVSTEMLEHTERPWHDLFEWYLRLRPGGRLIVTARGFDVGGAFGWHNPPDRWRYGPGVLPMMASDAGFVDVTEVADPQVPGWFLTGRRP